MLFDLARAIIVAAIIGGCIAVSMPNKIVIISRGDVVIDQSGGGMRSR